MLASLAKDKIEAAYMYVAVVNFWCVVSHENACAGKKYIVGRLKYRKSLIGCQASHSICAWLLDARVRGLISSDPRDLAQISPCGTFSSRAFHGFVLAQLWGAFDGWC